MAFRLDGKAALVTGAGRGIGQAIARKLAGLGAHALVNDLDAAAVDQTLDEIRSAGGVAEGMAADLTSPEVPQLLIQRLVDCFGGPDIIVNNAGYTWDNVIQKTTDQQFQAMLDIHVIAPFRILRAAYPYIRERVRREAEQGVRVMRKVVNITSISALYGNPGQSGYASGKAAIIGLTKTLAKEWGRYNVNVNCVAFGIIETRLTRPWEADESLVRIGDKVIRVGVRQENRELLEKLCPLGRFGTPEEAASAVLFFCSPLSDYVTGEVLTVSGGLTF